MDFEKLIFVKVYINYGNEWLILKHFIIIDFSY